MRLLTLVVEGPEDVMVLRKWTQVRWPDASHSRDDADGTRWQVSITDQSALEIVPARGKSRLGERVVDLVGRSTPKSGLDVLICFDRDDESPQQAENAIARQLADVASSRGKFDTHPEWRFTRDRREIRIELARWEGPADPRFVNLPEHRCLERVLIGGILTASAPDRIAWAATSTASLLALVSDHGWKRAFRIWGALLRPEVELSLYEALFQRDAALRDACAAAVAGSEVGKRIEEHLGR
jgi:hypothetical protein